MKCFIVLECMTYFLPPMVMKVYWKREVTIFILRFPLYMFGSGIIDYGDACYVLVENS